MAKPVRIGAEAALSGLPLWSAASGRDAITRTLTFADFASAFGFMTRIALVADKMDHHPEWSNVYSRVSILLATHESDGVTERDVALAQAIDGAAREAGAR
jgi:4a-hydroxytetrahydrobiopterin dehydratase